jgi:hypothetical protein
MAKQNNRGGTVYGFARTGIFAGILTGVAAFLWLGRKVRQYFRNRRGGGQ